MYPVTVILPAYNEAGNIEASLKDVASAFPLAQIVVVDDGSQDDTAARTTSLQGKHPNIQLIRNQTNQGKGYSLRQGVEASHGKMVAFLDSDGDIAASECKKLVDLLLSEPSIDIAIGTKRGAESLRTGSRSRFRSLARNLGNRWIQFLLLPGITDTQCGVKAFRGDIVRSIAPRTQMDRWSFDIELLALARRGGYRIREEPVQWRETGKSHVNWLGYLSTFVDVCRIYFRL